MKRARAKQLAPDEFQSGTFTISNLGNFGADIFDAILPPGAAPCAARCSPLISLHQALGSHLETQSCSVVVT